jgi:hypothetical protein
MQEKLQLTLSAAIKIRNEHAHLIDALYRDGKITSVFIAPADLEGFHRYCDNKRDGMDEEINLMESGKNRYSVYIKYECADPAEQYYYILLVDYLKATGQDFDFIRYGLKPLSLLSALAGLFYKIFSA